MSVAGVTNRRGGTVMKRTSVLVLLVASLLWATSASAGPTGLGTGLGTGNSWVFTFTNTTGGAPFDKIEMFIMTPGYSFDLAATVDVPGGWSGTLVNPGYTFISGTTFTGDQNITMYFSGTAPAGGVVVDFLTWNGASKVAGQVWQYTNIPSGGAGGAYQVLDPATLPDFNRAVPDGGATLVLLGGALMGLGILRRKFRG
jgi:hypothetical protein